MFVVGPNFSRPSTGNIASVIDGARDGAAALIARDNAVTYGELRTRVDAFRHVLVTELGVRPGDRVAIIAPTSVLFVESYLAALGAGAVVVPLNPTAPAEELQRELAAVGARVVVVGPGGRAAYEAIDPLEVAVEHVVVPRGLDLSGASALEDLVAAASGSTPVVARAANDSALAIFTAGTAGPSKAAVLSHGNVLANFEQVQMSSGQAVLPNDVGFVALPCFHVFGLNVGLTLGLAMGIPLVLIERFDPSATIEQIRRHGVTLIAAVPGMLSGWAALPEADAEDFASVRLLISGGAPLPVPVAEAFERRFGVEVHEGYGLTEAAPVVTSSAGIERRLGSVGRVLPGVELRLVDEDDDVDPGDEGEVWLRGANIFTGYFDDPVTTSRVLDSHGWLHTGDIGVLDEDGYLWLVDRSKDVVIVSGFNVFPADVEAVLLDHPSVAEAAVVGVDHPHTGQTVKAFVVMRDGAVSDEDELTQYCLTRMARYKAPTSIAFVSELPRGLAGKVLRRELREVS